MVSTVSIWRISVRPEGSPIIPVPPPTNAIGLLPAICNRFIKHPSEVLSVGDVVTVWVKEVDEKKKRISLTMRKDKL